MREAYGDGVLLRDLAWTAAVAELGHVTDAAAVLGTNQPTLSRALARVEDELGAQLFVRHPGGVRTTPAGRLVVEAATDLVARYDRLRADLGAELDPDAGVVRLAFLDSIATSLVPAVLRDVHEQLPAVRLVLRQEPAHAMLGDLASGTADLAITSPRPEQGHGWIPLQEERLVVVVPPSHRWRRRRQVRLTDLADEELVTTPPGFGFRTLVDGLLRDAGVAPSVSFESQDLATIEGLVAAGLGVALVPEPFAGLTGSVGLRLAGAPAARRTIGLTWRLDRDLPPPTRRVLDLVRAGVAGSPSSGGPGVR